MNYNDNFEPENNQNSYPYDPKFSDQNQDNSDYYADLNQENSDHYSDQDLGYDQENSAYQYPGQYQDQYAGQYENPYEDQYPDEYPDQYQDPYPDEYPDQYQDPYPDEYLNEYPNEYPDQTPAEDLPAASTARQKQMKLLGIVVVVVIVLVTALVKSAGPKAPAQPGGGAQVQQEIPGEVFQNFHFQLPEAWKALEAEKPEEVDFTRSYVPQNASKGEIFTIYTPGPSQQTQAALEKLSEEEILTSYLEAVQQDSQVHEFSSLEDSYPLGLPHRSYSYKFSQDPDLAYVVNTVVLREGQLFVFQTAADASNQAWVDTAHAEILQSLKLK